MKKFQKILFSIMILSLLTIPTVFAVTAVLAETPAQALKNTAVGIGFLFSGDIPLMVDFLIAGGTVYLVGIFFIIYYLMLHISQLTLFRGDEHKKAAHGVAIGFALLGTATPQVYKLTVNLLGGTLLIVLLIAFFAYSIWGMFKSSKTSAYKISAENYKEKAAAERVHADFVKEEGTRKKIDHEEGFERALEAQEVDLVSKSDNALDELESEAHSLKEQLEKIRQILGSLGGISDERRANVLRQNLLSRTSAFTNYIHRGKQEVLKLEQVTVNLEAIDKKELRLDVDEKKTLNKWRSALKEEISSAHNLSGKPKEIAEHFKEHILVGLREALAQAYSLDSKRESLSERIKKLESGLLAKYDQLDNARNQLVNDLNKNRIQEAISAVNKAEAIDIELSHELKQIEVLEKEVEVLLEHKRSLENKMKILSNKARQVHPSKAETTGSV